MKKYISDVFLFLFIMVSSVSIQAQELSHEKNKQVKKNNIQVSININKIYGVNELNETYIIDGYLVASWKDKALAKEMQAGKISPTVYENDEITTALKTHLWIPAFEFINVVGHRSVGNKQVVTSANGEVVYNERFQATFTSPMDFRKFPFDQQKLSIQLESFSYDKKRIEFVHPKVYPELIQQKLLSEWDIVNKHLYISTQDYSHLSDDGSETLFSRYNLDIDLKRKSNYYILNFMLPLMLIIISSWCVFWIKDFQTKLSTSFMLMLTVVAFNFQASSLLPKLPYTTFMGSLTILGYLSIFAGLTIVLFGELQAARKAHFDSNKLMVRSRIIFPLFLCLTIGFEIWAYRI